MAFEFAAFEFLWSQVLYALNFSSNDQLLFLYLACRQRVLPERLVELDDMSLHRALIQVT